jgi:protein-disulfide isomerase
MNNRGTIIVTAILAALAGAGGVALAMGAAAPATQVGTTDRAAIEAIVREYILTHPEILPEAMRNLEMRETKKAVEANRKALETPFANAWQGATDADVTLVEFFDYACGYCRASRADIDKLLAEDKKLKVVYRELPILGELSVEAARASLTAASGANYALFHKSLFGAGKLTADTLKAARSKAGVDLGKSDQQAIMGELTGNIRLQQELRLSGTPGWVIGDKVYNGAVGYDELKKAIAEARAAKAG